MIFLPIVERELRVAARRKATYWTRFGAVLGVLTVWLLLVAGSGRLSTVQLSQHLFVAFGILMLGFCLVAGVFLTADCLSEEKREGTLGLLFLTDLRGHDVVLGKLVVTSVLSFFGVLAIFPILGLPLLMGGVTFGEFWRILLVLAVTLLLSLSVGMLISAVTRETRQAMAGTLLVMLVLAGVLPALYWLHFVLAKSVPSGIVLLPSPIHAFSAAFDHHYRTRNGPHEFWLSLQFIFFLAVGCLVVAALILPRVWQENGQVIRHRGQGWLASKPGKEIVPEWVVRSRLLDKNPFLWVAQQDSVSQNQAWAAVVLLFVLWLAFLVISVARPKVPQAFIACLFISYALHQIVKIMAAVEATRRMNEDRRSGALELLLVTPLREGDIIKGLVAGFHQKFHLVRTLLMFTNLCMVFVVLCWGSEMHMNGDVMGIFFELFLGGTLMLYLDLKAISEVGIWMGLRSVRHHRAILRTLGRVLAANWVAVFLLVFLMFASRGFSPGTLASIFALWFIVGFVNDAIVISHARTKLESGLRRCIEDTQAPIRIEAGDAYFTHHEARITSHVSP